MHALIPMNNGSWAWLLCGAILLGARGGFADEAMLLISGPPAEGPVIARVDLTAAARWCGATPVAAERVRATAEDGRPVAMQFIPAADFDGESRVAGVVVLQLPTPPPQRLRLVLDGGAEPGGDANEASPEVVSASSPVSVALRDYTVTHDSGRGGGFPARIDFPASGKVFDAMRWNNRLHHRELGSFCACDDAEASAELVASGPLCSVVRVRGHFVQGGNKPATLPSAVYDWHYFHDRPLAFVTATVRQREPFTWHEVHFLEMNYRRETFPRWAGGEPLEEGAFQETMTTHGCPSWGLVHDGSNGIGMFQCGQALFYDAGPATYLQAHGDVAWQEWSSLERQFSAWLWIGSHEEPARAVQLAAHRLPAAARVTVTVDGVRATIDEAARSAAAGFGEGAGQATRPQAWRIEAAEQLEAQGRFEEALAVVGGQTPDGWTAVSAGDLTMVLERREEGIRLLNLFDAQSRQRLAADQPLPLFALTLRNEDTREELRVDGDAGWQVAEVVAAQPPDPAAAVELRWQRPVDDRLGDLQVVARAVPDAAAQSITWRLSIAGQAAPWSLWRVVFPQVSIPELGAGGCVLFPKGSGEVQRDVWERTFRFAGTYPSGWTTMQFMAAYRADRQSGLYLAVHDPWGSTKDLLCESRSPEGTVVMQYDHPVADMGRAGNRFELAGEAVWKLLRGDWFDASVHYRDWVRQHAKWYPQLVEGERADTPPWMRELPAWAQVGGPPDKVVEPVRKFGQFLGTPVGFHWYNWHQIPFDNDYPHYFPTKEGFAEGVRNLQDAGVFVMPYINGRLWDTRDRGTEDFQFTAVAKAAVSKDEKGEPYTETYGSKEADGSPVRLGVMCPATPLWQSRVREIVLRLMNECGVKGVYIDQVAAAAPTLCFDASHGHPLGGGHWWTEGYWKLLDELREAMPPGAMLTTECNGEPYIRSFDGYLTWHWQYDGQVPAFPAVYGGAIQMFGRSYGGGETRHLALRMKAAQQLVFGEQIGWLNPALAMEPDSADFFRAAVRLRHELQPYFARGEMARPPELASDLPTVRADWQWFGTTWVTTDAVLTGAWHLPLDNRLVLIFANVSDEPVSAKLDYALAPYGFRDGRLSLCEIGPEGRGSTTPTGATVARDVSLPPRALTAWEVSSR